MAILNPLKAIAVFLVMIPVNWFLFTLFYEGILGGLVTLNGTPFLQTPTGIALAVMAAVLMIITTIILPLLLILGEQ